MMGQRRTDLAIRQFLLGKLRETLGKCLTLHHPPLLMTEQFGSRGHRQAVFFEKGADDESFVEGCQASTRRVGKQKKSLVISRGTGGFEDDRYMSTSLGLPNGKALESVEDLESPVLCRGDTDGQGFELAFRPDGRGAGSKGRKACVQAIDGNEQNIPRLRCGNSWFRHQKGSLSGSLRSRS